MDHHLGDAVMVAQVDEEELAVITLAMHPPRQLDGQADVACAQRAAIVGTIGMHEASPKAGAGRSAGKARRHTART